jgi:hypothetical protein
MIDIIAQMNPAALAALILLLALGFLGAVVLKLIKSGRAKSPKDLVQVARDRAAASKASKEAVKQAEAAIAEPITSSRLSRIGAWQAEAEAEEVVEGDEQEARDAPEAFAEAEEPLAADHAYAVEAEAEQEPIKTSAEDALEETVENAPTPLDLADPANHPQNWDALVAVVDALDVALQLPWPEDRILPVPRFEDSVADPEGAARAASQRQSAIQLARTINGAAREQAQEVIAVVREFAHSAPFSPQDCAAVMDGLQAIEWMALVERGALVEKRTLPLTRHDPEAPLWVHDAVNAVYREARRHAA